MPSRDQTDLVDSWIAKCKAPGGPAGASDRKKHNWAFGAWFGMRDDVEAVWSFILAVIQKGQSRRVMELTAAGPLEDLLADHGSEVIERVESEAKSNPSFARLLAGVWQSDTPTPFWRRVQVVWDRRGWDGIPAE
jgi:hypothetical protein